MLDSLWEWVFGALPFKVQIGCLVVALLGIAGVLLLAWQSGWLEG